MSWIAIPTACPEEERLFWFRGIASGVSYLHEHGIVHRDLKPGNIFLDDRTVKIGDYGLSKFISCSRRSGQTESVGTFHYMAPEIGKGVYGKEIDVYALGVMLYEMLTGELPFDGESSQEIIMKHLTASPDLTRIDARYRETIRRALQKDPDQRFRDVPSMMRTLPGAAAGVTFVSPQSAWAHDASPSGGSSRRPPVRVAVDDAPRTPDVVFLNDRDIAGKAAAGEAKPAADQAVDQAALHNGIAFGPLNVNNPEAERVAAQHAVRSTLFSNEPVAEMVRGGYHRARQRWSDSRLGTPARAFLIVLAAILAMINIHWLLPLGVMVGAVYLMYLGVRGLMFAFTGESAPSNAATPLPVRTQGRSSAPPIRRPAAAPVVRPRPRKATADELRRLAIADYRRQPASQRLSQFTASLMLALPTAMLTVLVVLAFTGTPLDASVAAWSQAAWIGLCGGLGAWVLLALGRMWASGDEDAMLRRTTMVAVGAGLGAVLWALGGFLMVTPTEMLHMADGNGLIAPDAWYVNGMPKAPACMAYFALVCALGGWWKLTDPLRPRRVSVLHIGALVALAWFAHLIIYFPQPWGMLLAGSMAFATQLAAPYTPRRERRRLAAIDGMVA